MKVVPKENGLNYSGFSETPKVLKTGPITYEEKINHVNELLHTNSADKKDNEALIEYFNHLKNVEFDPQTPNPREIILYVLHMKLMLKLGQYGMLSVTINEFMQNIFEEVQINDGVSTLRVPIATLEQITLSDIQSNTEMSIEIWQDIQKLHSLLHIVSSQQDNELGKLLANPALLNRGGAKSRRTRRRRTRRHKRMRKQSRRRRH